MNSIVGKPVLYSTVLFVLFLHPAMQAARQKIDINSDWRFIKEPLTIEDAVRHFERKEGKKINLPHTWNTDIVQGNGYYTGLAWYAKEIEVGPSIQEKRLFLRFEGSLDVTTVYLNGEKLGKHAGGYSAFVFEITDHVKTGRNQLVVSVDNSQSQKTIPGMAILFTRYGGIYRPVWLIETDEICITPMDYAGPGVYLKQQKVTHDAAEVQVCTKLSNRLKKNYPLLIKTTVSDQDGNTILQMPQDYAFAEGQEEIELQQQFVIEDPHLWHGRQDPYLYKVKVEVFQKNEDKIGLLDMVEQPLGLRFYHVDPDKGFFLNGEAYRLNGVCRHQDWDLTGSALQPEHHKKDVELILEVGATAVRLAHYQQAEDIYSLCDQSGLIVWAEIPVVIGYNLPQYQNAKQQMLELIRQNYNHPSILFWGLQNESSIQIDDLRGLHELCKSEDATRMTTMAYLFSQLQNIGVPDLLGINSYYGWYGKTPLQAKEKLDHFHKKHPAICFGLSEYGAGGCIAHQEQGPNAPNPLGYYFPEQYQCQFHEEYWDVIRQSDYLWCSFIWNMFDFGWSVVKRGDRPHMNHKGLVTWDRRTKKDAFYFYKSNWSDTAVLHITSKRHDKRDNKTTDVKVYSNCDQVELRVNGKSVGNKAKTNCHNNIYIWPAINLSVGNNVIQAEGIKDGVSHKDQCTWILQ